MVYFLIKFQLKFITLTGECSRASRGSERQSQYDRLISASSDHPYAQFMSLPSSPSPSRPRSLSWDTFFFCTRKLFQPLSFLLSVLDGHMNTQRWRHKKHIKLNDMLNNLKKYFFFIFSSTIIVAFHSQLNLCAIYISISLSSLLLFFLSASAVVKWKCGTGVSSSDVDWEVCKNHSPV